MTDAPERMWRETIAPNRMYQSGGSFYHESHKPKTGNVVEYIRADAVRDLPEVKALVEALLFYAKADHYLSYEGGESTISCDCGEVAATALAAFEVKK